MNGLVGRRVPAPAPADGEPGNGAGGLRWDHRTIYELVPPGGPRYSEVLFVVRGGAGIPA